MKSRARLHAYWRTPDDGVNQPEDYLTGRCKQRTETLVSIVERLPISQSAPILEVGCNAGRNLEALRLAGYEKLWGIEISEGAIELMRKQYPELDYAKIRIAPVENVIEDGVSDCFDLVFTMAVLQHIHPSSEWVFAEMARITRYIITIEDEYTRSWRHKPRNYGRVFEKLGMEQIGMGAIRGLGPRFIGRAFRKEAER